MEVILLERMRSLGDLGDKVGVKAGYFRNYLGPQKKAVVANETNQAVFEKRRAELEKKAKQDLAKAEQRAAKLNDITLLISAMASDEGKLYGSVGANEIQEALLAKKIEVDKREIVMPMGAFHSVGNFSVEIHLHSDVIANLQLEIVGSDAK